MDMKGIKRSSTLSVLLALGLFLAVACGDDGGDEEADEADQDGETAAAEEEVTLGLVLQNYTNPAILDIAEAARAEADAHGNVTLLDEDSENIEDQVAAFETMIAQGVDAIGVEPWVGEAFLPQIQSAHDAGVPVFTVQDDAPGAVDEGTAVSYIASDEVQGGMLVGEWLVEALDGSGTVAIIEGATGDSPAIHRTEGFMAAIEGTDLEVVAQQTANWARDEGLDVATDILSANPDLSAMFVHNDEMAFGALEALRAAGVEDDVILTGYNGTCIGLEATVNGDFQAEGILFLDEVGREFVTQALAHLAGESVPPRIQPPIAALDTEELEGVLDGTTSVEEFEGLAERVEVANAGEC